MKLVVALAVLAFAPPASAATVNVQFQAFGPSQAEVLPGETVQWENVSERTHTVTADDGSFDSGDLDPGVNFAVNFASAGTFAYHCTKHAGMTGAVAVEPGIPAGLPTAPIPGGDWAGVPRPRSPPGEPGGIRRPARGAR